MSVNNRTSVLKLKTLLSNTIGQYAGFSNNVSMTKTESELGFESKIEGLLDDFEKLTSNNSGNKGDLRRLRDDYKRIKLQIEDQRNKLNLLDDVRSDIQMHHDQQNLNNDEDYMLGEREMVDRSHNVMDNLISQVMNTRDEFLRQRSVLNQAGSTLDDVLIKIPGIDVLLKKIHNKHKREKIVLGSVILICLIILWFCL